MNGVIYIVQLISFIVDINCVELWLWDKYVGDIIYTISIYSSLVHLFDIPCCHLSSAYFSSCSIKDWL